MVFLLAVAIVAAPADRNAQTIAYMHCVRRMARRLEPSGDAPEDVAKAATVYCQKFEAPLFASNADDAKILRETAIYYGAAEAVDSQAMPKNEGLFARSSAVVVFAHRLRFGRR
jgi:hypothetical protein